MTQAQVMNHHNDPSKEHAKAAKKQAKATAKIEKKKEAAGPQSQSTSTPNHTADITPAERSAAAAERQVRLQRWRVAIAVLTFLVVAATFLFSMRERESVTPDSAEPSESVQP